MLEVVTFRCERRAWERFRAQAAARGLSVGQLLRLWIDEADREYIGPEDKNKNRKKGGF